ncbi:glycosyltransferase family 2 protein [Halioxenophilus sp. WMMB6]|uniref:glycosyltransferase family 2 protein n=1 Tax=Halioxenophilus sp. WMMB6 TaxID=3073815 RepID=UPI00295ED4C3|nr:glycosyltransferase family 2 protein [Halioxenophilus sp. WMMB6]
MNGNFIRPIEGKLLSVVVPCFNEQEVISETNTQLLTTLSRRPFRFEILYINDGSSDATEVLLNNICAQQPECKCIHLSRNFGHQNAVSAGLDFAAGDLIVLIDADLQDPPEVILTMIEHWQRGYDVAYGVRTQRLGESPLKLLTAKYFYRILNQLSDTPIPLNTGDFRLMDRQVVNAIHLMPERDRFLRGMISWVGFNQCAVTYQRQERFAGASKYPLIKMLRFATDGILSFSNKPLRLATWMGLTASALALVGIFYAITLRLLTDNWVSGWTFLAVTILFMGGVQMLFLGLIGEYIGRIYQATKNRPIYLIRDKKGF